MKTRTRVLGASLLTVLVAAAATVVVLERRPDATPLLGNVGATLSRVPVDQDLATFDMGPTQGNIATNLEPGLDLGQVLRRDGNGPWYRQVIDPDRVDIPYVAGTAVCGDGETVLVAGGNIGTNLEGGVFLEEVQVAVPTIWRSVSGKPWARIAVKEAPQPSSLRSIVSARKSGRLDRLVAVGESLAAGGRPYVAVSDDCGTTWTVSELPGGRANTVADAVLVDDRGLLVVGRTDANVPDERSVIVWNATEPDQPLTFTATIVETNASLSGQVPFVRRAEQSIGIGLVDRGTRSAAFLLWDGTPAGIFARVGEPVDQRFPIALVDSVAGPLLLSFANGGRQLELRRFTSDGAAKDALPRIDGQSFRQVRFVGDGGSTMWVIGEREDFELRAWSITLPSTASCAEQVNGGTC